MTKAATPRTTMTDPNRTNGSGEPRPGWWATAADASCAFDAVDGLVASAPVVVVFPDPDRGLAPAWTVVEGDVVDGDVLPARDAPPTTAGTDDVVTGPPFDEGRVVVVVEVTVEHGPLADARGGGSSALSAPETKCHPSTPPLLT
jgi:hypothetical protein